LPYGERVTGVYIERGELFYMYGDKSKKWIMLCLGSILFFCIVCVIYMIDVSKRWDNVWGMNGSYIIYENGADNPQRIQKCVFDKTQYQDYRFRFGIAQTKGTCTIRLLDEREMCIKEWKDVSMDFEEILEENVADALDTVEVVASGDSIDDDVVYRIDIDGKKNFKKIILND